MDFIQHTTNWVKGEIFEATIFGSFGLLTIICSLLFWKFGVSPNSKAVIIPFAIVGVFFLATAISGIVSNNKRLTEYTEAFQKDKKSFIESEKKRVEDFQYLYKMTVIIAAVSFAVAICFFLFTDNYILRAIGLALIVFGLTGLIIDYFSKERADNYYKAITTEIESHYS
jgi:predicted histidine transporter YuiF (NhaC family)